MMTHYDDPTKKFMSDVAGEQPSEDKKKEYLTRQGLGVIRDVVTSSNPSDFAKKIIKRSVRAATILPEIEKKAGLDLFEYMTDKYADRWYHWEPETLWQTLEYDGIDIDDELKNAIQAFQVVALTNFAFEDWHVFEKVGHAFNQNPVNFGHVQPLELDEVAYTIKIMCALRPKEEFEDDVKGYIAAAAKEAGVVYLPEDFFPKGCQDFLDKMGNDIKLKNLVANNYPGKLEEESALGIQLARLAEIKDYVGE